jgi:hypothetical protein
LSRTPMLLAVTPLPSPLTTPPVTNTYFMAQICPILVARGGLNWFVLDHNGARFFWFFVSKATGFSVSLFMGVCI